MNWKCFVYGRQYEIIERYEIIDKRENKVGVIIVSRCKVCGKITHYKIYYVMEYER